MPDPRDGMSLQEIEYWGTEFCRLRIRQALGITFDTFITLNLSTRHELRRWMLDRLKDWRDNPRWSIPASRPVVLGWSTEDTRDARATIEPGIADFHPQ